MNYFLILAQKHSDNVDNFMKLFCEKQIIYDDKENDIFYKKQGFYDTTMLIKQPCCWDKAFFYLNNNEHLLKQYEYFYFSEDDVYTQDITTLDDCIKTLNFYDYDLVATDIVSRDHSKSWMWWTEKTDVDKYFQNPHRSFNPLCRLSTRLVKKILDFRLTYNKLYFHEILFASLCVDNNFTYADIKQIATDYIGIFHFRPIIDKHKITNKKIYHPVKPVYESK